MSLVVAGVFGVFSFGRHQLLAGVPTRAREIQGRYLGKWAEGRRVRTTAPSPAWCPRPAQPRYAQSRLPRQGTSRALRVWPAWRRHRARRRLWRPLPRPGARPRLLPVHPPQLPGLRRRAKVTCWTLSVPGMALKPARRDRHSQQGGHGTVRGPHRTDAGWETACRDCRSVRDRTRHGRAASSRDLRR